MKKSPKLKTGLAGGQKMCIRKGLTRGVWKKKGKLPRDVQKAGDQ